MVISKPFDDLPDLFSNSETGRIAIFVQSEADRLGDLTIDAIRTIEPTTGILTGMTVACRAVLAKQAEPLPLAIGLVFRRSEPQPHVLAGALERWPRNEAAERRAQALLQAGEAAMTPEYISRFKSREQKLRRFPDGLRTSSRRDQSAMPIDGIEVFRALFEGTFEQPGPDVRALAEAMVLLRFCEAVERQLSAEPVETDVFLYVDGAEWPYETGDLDYAPSIIRLLTGDGILVPAA